MVWEFEKKYSGNVSAKRSKNLKAEIYCKAIAHNIWLRQLEIFN